MSLPHIVDNLKTMVDVFESRSASTGISSNDEDSSKTTSLQENMIGDECKPTCVFDFSDDDDESSDDSLDDISSSTSSSADREVRMILLQPVEKVPDLPPRCDNPAL